MTLLNSGVCHNHSFLLMWWKINLHTWGGGWMHLNTPWKVCPENQLFLMEDIQQSLIISALQCEILLGTEGIFKTCFDGNKGNYTITLASIPLETRPLYVETFRYSLLICIEVVGCGGWRTIEWGEEGERKEEGYRYYWNKSVFILALKIGWWKLSSTSPLWL